MHKLEKLILESYGELLNEALSYSFSEYNFTIEDEDYQAEVEANIKKELKEIPEKDLQAIIKNAENYFAKEARKEEKANRKPRKIKSTEFAQFAADYYTEEYYPENYGKEYPGKRPVSKPVSDDKDLLKSFDGIDIPSTPEEREMRRRSKLRLKHGYAAYFIPSRDLPKDLFYSMSKDEFNKTFGRIVDEPTQDELIDGNIDILFDKPINEERGTPYKLSELTPQMRKQLEDRYGKSEWPDKDFVSQDMTTYFKTIEVETKEEGGGVKHKVIKLPSFDSLYFGFSDLVDDVKKLMGNDDVRQDRAARELFELIKTNFRKVQRYLRTERPDQYELMKMRRNISDSVNELKSMYPPSSLSIGGKEVEDIIKVGNNPENWKVKFVDGTKEPYLNHLKEITMNDPVMIKVRQAKMRADQMKKLDAYKKSPEGRAAARAQAKQERREEKAREIVRKLKIKRAQVMSDMENDPDIEPAGGPVADMYGAQLNKIDNSIEKAASVYNKNMTYDQAVGKINEFVGGNTEKRISALFDKLVPGSGNADTVEGEIIRAINRIIYRWGNDGDRFWYGYGAETVGPPMEYLTDSSDIPLEIRNKFKAWENDNFGQDYNEKELEDLAQIALQYVEKKVREDDLSQNDDDIFNYGEKYIEYVKDMEDEEDEYDDYYDDEDEDDEYYQEGIKEQVEKEGAELPDATDIMLQKFPTLKATLIKLQTEDFKEFVEKIDWISPRPTEFRINLTNGQDYILKWTGRGFEAQIMGKRYMIDKIDDYQQALDKLAILYKEGPMGEPEEPVEPADTDTAGGGGGGDFPGEDDTGAGEEAPDDAGDEGGEEEGGADLGDEPVDFEEPAEEPEA